MERCSRSVFNFVRPLSRLLSGAPNGEQSVSYRPFSRISISPGVLIVAFWPLLGILLSPGSAILGYEPSKPPFPAEARTS